MPAPLTAAERAKQAQKKRQSECIKVVCVTLACAFLTVALIMFVAFSIPSSNRLLMMRKRDRTLRHPVAATILNEQHRRAGHSIISLERGAFPPEKFIILEEPDQKRSDDYRCDKRNSGQDPLRVVDMCSPITQRLPPHLTSSSFCRRNALDIGATRIGPMYPKTQRELELSLSDFDASAEAGQRQQHQQQQQPTTTTSSAVPNTTVTSSSRSPISTTAPLAADWFNSESTAHNNNNNTSSSSNHIAEEDHLFEISTDIPSNDGKQQQHTLLRQDGTVQDKVNRCRERDFQSLNRVRFDMERRTRLMRDRLRVPDSVSCAYITTESIRTELRKSGSAVERRRHVEAEGLKLAQSLFNKNPLDQSSFKQKHQQQQQPRSAPQKNYVVTFATGGFAVSEKSIDERRPIMCSFLEHAVPRRDVMHYLVSSWVHGFSAMARNIRNGIYLRRLQERNQSEKQQHHHHHIDDLVAEIKVININEWPLDTIADYNPEHSPPKCEDIGFGPPPAGCYRSPKGDGSNWRVWLFDFYLRVLLRDDGSVGNIMHVDSRDAFFQAPPFSFESDLKLKEHSAKFFHQQEKLQQQQQQHHSSSSSPPSSSSTDDEHPPPHQFVLLSGEVYSLIEHQSGPNKPWMSSLLGNGGVNRLLLTSEEQVVDDNDDPARNSTKKKKKRILNTFPRTFPSGRPLSVLNSGLYLGSLYALREFVSVFKRLLSCSDFSHGVDQGCYAVTALYAWNRIQAPWPLPSLFVSDPFVGPFTNFIERDNVNFWPRRRPWHNSRKQNSSSSLLYPPPPFVNCAGRAYVVNHQLDRHWRFWSLVAQYAKRVEAHGAPGGVVTGVDTRKSDFEPRRGRKR